jgi:rhodanese-related sulfurtransferase
MEVFMKNIIDIRNKNKYLINHISGSINIESLELLSNPNKYLDKDKVYYLYCDSGYTSSIVSNKLNMLGFNTVNIEGGFNNYLLRK